MSDFLQTPIEFLKGVGQARADLLKKELNIFTFEDLLYFYPYRHIDRTRFYKISELQDDLPYIQLRGKFTDFRTEKLNRGQRLTGSFTDGTGHLEIVWFQGAKWVKELIKPQTEYILFGKPAIFNGKFNMVHPSVDLYNDENIKMLSALMPMYNTTEKMKQRNFESKSILKLLHNLLKDERLIIPENLPDKLISKENMLARGKAIHAIHFPGSAAELTQATERLKFEELFFLQIRILRYKVQRGKLHNGICFEHIGELFNTFYEKHLPFNLTEAQKRVIREIRGDMKSGVQMNRLLQGDVGSGKTIVALLCMLIAIDNNYQATLMAPTEILAQQHFHNLQELLSGLPVSIRLLTGNTSSKDRKKMLQDLESGSLNILIGTHALIENAVQYKNLGLVIIDEQHRFGVEQRSRLWQKNEKPPHVLVMTATPIPRTLAMTVYGDLDVSVIDELPAGRKPIKTIHRFESGRLAVFEFMKQELSKGRQIYIVYPLIAESEKMDYMNLQDGFESVSRAFPLPQYKVSIVHGKMKPADKDFEMARFVKGETNIMVATTVIEVGVNVPNASVMIIESAERFGLSQLHQLRGRVGRGAEQSYCILMTGNKLGNEAKTRIKTMEQSNDGFYISEVDLKLRGPGDLEGTQQSGLLDLKLADLKTDDQILQRARNSASKLLGEDAGFSQPENLPVKLWLSKQQRHAKVWSRIS
ncbi:MAG: ATP-dependent DNA helicase RecG [Bacteroidia bacterium]|nr:ATP-dependent DNA helicase RecG [Bacteroidia bacterium]